MRPAFFQICGESFEGGYAEGDDALLVAFATDQYTAGIEREIAGGKTGHFRDSKPTRIQEFKNCPVAEGGGARLGMIGRMFGGFEHRVHFRFGEGLGQDFPGFWRFDIDGGVVVNAPVQKEPFVKSADAAQLAGGRAGVDTVGAEGFDEGGDVLLRGVEEHSVAAFEELRKGLHIAVVGLAGERTEALFDAQVGEVLPQQFEIAGGLHNPIMGWQETKRRS